MVGSDVTVVIPTHRRDAFLEEAIASVVAQRLPPAALIVSDDVGSSSTAQTVARWQREVPFPVRYLDSSGPGAGTAGASRNAGAALVTTDRLAFLDDDDVWDPMFLAAMTEAFEQGDSVAFAVAWTAADREGYVIDRIRPGLSAADVVARNPGFMGSTFAMRTDVFRMLGGFDPGLAVSEDKDLLVRALLASCEYVAVERELVRNRIHGTGQLTDKTERRVEAIERYMAKHADLLGPLDRLALQAQVASIRRVTAPTGTGRAAALVRLVTSRSVLAVTRGRR